MCTSADHYLDMLHEAEEELRPLLAKASLSFEETKKMDVLKHEINSISVELEYMGESANRSIKF